MEWSDTKQNLLDLGLPGSLVAAVGLLLYLNPLRYIGRAEQPSATEINQPSRSWSITHRKISWKGVSYEDWHEDISETGGVVQIEPESSKTGPIQLMPGYSQTSNKTPSETEKPYELILQLPPTSAFKHPAKTSVIHYRCNDEKT